MAIIFKICLIMFLCLPARAENSPASVPVPKNKTQAIDAFNARLNQESKKKKQLETQAEKIKKNLSDTKKLLIKIASDIQENESKIKNFEQRIINLELKKSVLEDKLNSERASIASLILALERIRRTPPEAMLARPDSPYKTAQSAMIMGKIVPSITRHAEEINKNIETLNQVTKELDSEKEELLFTSENLKKRHDELSGLIDKRKKLYRQTNKDIHMRELSIQKISLEAKNLNDLVKKIKEDEKKIIEQQKVSKFIKKPKPAIKIIDSGLSRLPVPGIIRTKYKQRDDLGANSKGLTIEGRAGALVIAPINGKIQFTGAFKRYGNIVIIEHANGYHSLIAGLDKITSVIGDNVKTGEPIGFLPNSSLIPRPTLYYELRKNGKPVNPAVKFPDLG